MHGVTSSVSCGPEAMKDWYYDATKLWIYPAAIEPAENIRLNFAANILLPSKMEALSYQSNAVYSSNGKEKKRWKDIHYYKV